MRVLVLGGTGQIGSELCALALATAVEIIAPPRSLLNLENSAAVADAVAAGPWDAVINAAGYTNVDAAEDDQSTAFATNAVAASCVATETGKLGIPLVHISTDYVFDGRKGAPYVENDLTSPVNVYGQSKLAGENGVRDANPRHIILRTSWVHSPHGKNFVRTILRLARSRERLTVVADQRGCPTAARDIAKVCLDIAMVCAQRAEHASYGVYHFAGSGETTWFEMASAIISVTASRLQRLPEVVPISTAEYRTAALRPADSRLDCTAIVRDFGVVLRPWRSALAETIEQLISNGDLR